MTGTQVPQFPPDFVWGAATASYQVEGAVDADGRGRSIWDTFAHTPGNVAGGDTGDVACDHYHRYDEDAALMADLGLGAYRFSIAWPRIQPDGSGPVNPAGLDFYDRLVDALIERDIAPAATLFHWDLPQALEDRGGWLARETAERFADYAALVADRLGDRVAYWMTINEPTIFTSHGYATGVHAPGRTLGGAAFPAAHHQLLGHGLAVPRLRANSSDAALVGIANNYAPAWPASDAAADVAAAVAYDAVHNRTYTDPILTGRYPDNLAELYPGSDPSVIADGDLAVIHTPLDFLGVNYYKPTGVRGAPGPAGYAEVRIEAPSRTGFDWPVLPSAFTELLVGLQDRYRTALPPIYITENGAAYEDHADEWGRVSDEDRIAFLAGHFCAVHEAMAAGIDVRGFFIWSLMDNFEWAAGFSRRFGLVRVDYPTQARTPKASYDWYQGVIAHSRGR